SIEDARSVRIAWLLDESLEFSVGDLGDKSVVPAGVGSLEGSSCGGEVGGRGIPRDVGRAPRIHRDNVTGFIAAATQVGGVDQPAAGGIKLGDKGVVGADRKSVVEGRGGGQGGVRGITREEDGA